MKDKMVKNTEISGKAVAVVVGVICLIAPWFSSLGPISKFLIAVVGILLIYLGVRD